MMKNDEEWGVSRPMNLGHAQMIRIYTHEILEFIYRIQSPSVRCESTMVHGEIMKSSLLLWLTQHVSMDKSPYPLV